MSRPFATKANADRVTGIFRVGHLDHTYCLLYPLAHLLLCRRSLRMGLSTGRPPSSFDFCCPVHRLSFGASAMYEARLRIMTNLTNQVS